MHVQKNSYDFMNTKTIKYKGSRETDKEKRVDEGNNIETSKILLPY